VASRKGTLLLNEYKDGKAEPIGYITFPAYGKTDADVFENNFLEVMQFVFKSTHI